MASEIISILRTENLTPVVDKKDSNTEEWNSLALRCKCARLQNRTKMYTGLGYRGKTKDYDYDQERNTIKILFQEILSMDFNDNTVNEFRKEVNQYYEGLSCFIEHKGRDFEIGLLEDNNKPVSETNRPINVLDYITYKALFENDIEVAENETEGRSASFFWFYKKSKTQEKKEQLLKQENISYANTCYDKIRELSLVHKVMLSELGMIIEKEAIDNSIALHKFVNDNPVKFIELYNLYVQDKDKFISRLKLRRYCEQNIISKASHGGYIDVKANTDIASSLEEMLIFMTNPENREKMNNYDVIYKEKMM